MGVFYAARFGSDRALMLDRCARLEHLFWLAGCTAAALRQCGRRDSLHGAPPWQLARPPAGWRPAYPRGYGEMLAWQHAHDPSRARAACAPFGPRHAPACLEGVTQFRALIEAAAP
jgi:hypothetical protein